ncbi:T7SS effector LXG polymorphic toxin [Oceanobacillus kimchii]|uniref:T7SS effector LXG polymorphic toxin n=1 Tax=Oceanobacillus kimchii TaxID=746691 RepID=UPI0021A42765|nr:T7SS effector LXG polymorphic toxin [Oceanobacillus kimchii]MCT1578282.1 T7SS effector LXG polymorphic toxin [Oceanobacillus kimchii]MCT2134460.1 T7SS effector LXG polymorphic toxin [Oceanobacillus kimchii]
MSLSMYLGETDDQRNSMNAICIEIIQSMEQTKSSIYSFHKALLLQGITYTSAKSYLIDVYLPLTQGIIYLCEELIRQNDNYPSEFREQVATTDVIEQEVIEQIQEIDKSIEALRDATVVLPFQNMMIQIYIRMKQKLQEKLENLYAYNSSSSSNFDTAISLAKAVMTGLQQVQDGNGFNSDNGTFQTKGMDLSWISTIDDIHYTRKAEEHYAEYLQQYPEDKDKVIEIIKYEETNNQYVDQTNDFLSPLEDKDQIEIKFLMYTSEEPYRTMSLKYLDEVTIADPEAGGGAFYRSSDNSITMGSMTEDRTNARGAYFTFFHELGHAIDYNHGVKNGMDGFYSDHYTSNGKTLANQMHGDVSNRVQSEINHRLDDSKYDHLSSTEKQAIINNITEEFIYEGPSSVSLTAEEETLYGEVQTQISRELQADEHNNASDVYGGVTVNEIVGRWGHHDNSYWIDENSEERINEPNKEGFASYYAAYMLEDSEFKDQQLNSVGEFLPNSKEHMDEMLNNM